MNGKNFAKIWLAAAAAAMLLAGCSDTTEGEADGTTTDTTAEPAGPMPQAAKMGHVHGLGVSDGTLYVATHYGLFAVSDDGEAEFVGEDDHDFMGFTVVDDGTFLASGHPGSRSDLPGNLGLLESTDGGATWTSLSLLGEVDFHALDATEDAVYGHDGASGELLASIDRTNWERRGRFPVRDVAINPADSSTIVVTTGVGPQISGDGGMSFSVVGDAPLLFLIDWPQEDNLIGIAPDGIVYRSADGGSTWEARGESGVQPHAMTAGPDGALYVATADAILLSSDNGETFSIWYELT